MDLVTPSGARTVFGKPRGWTRGWTAVVVVWVVLAAVLAAARLEVGHVTALSAREAAAIDAVKAAPLIEGADGTGVTTAEGLQMVLKRYGTDDEDGGVARPQWYAIDRPWEDRVHVYWEFGDYDPLGWTVDDDGTVRPNAETRLLLTGLARLDGEAGP